MPLRSRIHCTLSKTSSYNTTSHVYARNITTAATIFALFFVASNNEVPCDRTAEGTPEIVLFPIHSIYSIIYGIPPSTWTDCVFLLS